MVSKEHLEELRVIIREKFGREVSDEELSEIGNGLADYFLTLVEIKARLEALALESGESGN